MNLIPQHSCNAVDNKNACKIDNCYLLYWLFCDIYIYQCHWEIICPLLLRLINDIILDQNKGKRRWNPSRSFACFYRGKQKWNN